MFPAFVFSGTELWGALACAALAAGFFGVGENTGAGGCAAGLRRRPGRSVWPRITYPPPRRGTSACPLALASRAGCGSLQRRDSAPACGWVALVVCGVLRPARRVPGDGQRCPDAATGLFAVGNPPPCSLRRSSLWSQVLRNGRMRKADPTRPKLPFLILPLRKDPAKQGGGLKRLALASATALVLLWESRGLPPLRARFGLEPNNGYGLLLLTVACLALYARRRDPALRQCAAALGIGNAALADGLRRQRGVPVLAAVAAGGGHRADGRHRLACGGRSGPPCGRRRCWPMRT